MAVYLSTGLAKLPAHGRGGGAATGTCSCGILLAHSSRLKRLEVPRAQYKGDPTADPAVPPLGRKEMLALLVKCTHDEHVENKKAHAVHVIVHDVRTYVPYEDDYYEEEYDEAELECDSAAVVAGDGYEGEYGSGAGSSSCGGGTGSGSSSSSSSSSDSSSPSVGSSIGGQEGAASCPSPRSAKPSFSSSSAPSSYSALLRRDLAATSGVMRVRVCLLYAAKVEEAVRNSSARASPDKIDGQ